MEMHQIRYFLAVSEQLNFTRAAEECRVAQPSLTRAVKLLEEELGGELFRRERRLTHLTEFGERMLPLMRQCYEAAASAKKLASTMRSGEVTPLSLALSRTIDMSILARPLAELYRALPGLELKILRGAGEDIVDYLREGEAELAVAGPLQGGWDRLDAWSLFSDPFTLVASHEHKFTQRAAVEVGDLAGEKFLLRPYCESARELNQILQGHGLAAQGHHQVVSEHDLIALLEARIGVGVLPLSLPCGDKLRRVAIEGVDLCRKVQLYGVAGRQRSPAAGVLVKLLRAHDWRPTLQ